LLIVKVLTDKIIRLIILTLKTRRQSLFSYNKPCCRAFLKIRPDVGTFFANTCYIVLDIKILAPGN